MLKIETSKGVLDLGGELTLQVEEKSPVMNERGSQSLPVTLPPTGKNMLLTGFPHRLDCVAEPLGGEKSCVVSDGVYRRRGIMNLVSASKRDGVTLNVGFDNSEAYEAWKKRKLNELSLPLTGDGRVSELKSLLQAAYTAGDGGDYAVFPIAVEREEITSGNTKTTYWGLLNRAVNGELVFPTSQQQPVDGVMTTVSLPDGYGVTPFLYVWRVLELVFEDLGYEIELNPFKGQSAGDLSKVVVLNNVADAICTGYLDYTDLLPDCEVQAFLHALYVRFGLVYLLNQDTKRVRLELIRDIIVKTPVQDITAGIADWPAVTYEAHKQLKLSAKTSLYNATPTNERLEDYIKGLSLTDLTTVERHATGDVISTALLLERVTGKLFKRDMQHPNNSTNIYTDSVSGFFNWDPQTEGVETEELSSEDECVPMFEIDNVYLPGYITGAVHRHSYIKGRESEKEENETPLAFVISYGQHGRITPPNNAQGERLSLLFQWNDGLFAQFWSAYDRIRRHAFNKIDLTMRMTPVQLLSLDLLQPVKYQGQVLLIDGVDYMLPFLQRMEVSLTLRTLRAVAENADDHTVPTIGPSTQTWKWVFYRSNLDEQVAIAHQDMIQNYGSADLIEVLNGDAWRSDSALQEAPPTGPGSIWRDYAAQAIFGVYETDEQGRTAYVNIPVNIAYRVGLVAEYS